MPKTTISQSQKRFLESMGALFESEASPANFLFLTSSTDEGVIRNGGRNGARFAPQAFLAAFKRFSQTSAWGGYSLRHLEVASGSAERADFQRAQDNEAAAIVRALASNPGAEICHIGGGHDHVYPLLRALGEGARKVIAINVDAHADTRTDEAANSGTPFRQFARDFRGDFHLFQIGLQAFSNSTSTLSRIPGQGMSVLWKKDLSEASLHDTFSEVERLCDSDTKVILSIDADALAAHQVPAVSAVNPDGLTRAELLRIFQRYKKLPLGHRPIVGIYELNPLYDSVSGLSMKTMASLVFDSQEG